MGQAKPKTSKRQAPAVVATSASVDEAPEWINRRATAQATRAANARQNSGRRRFVDPTTCEREYSKAEMEFMQAMQDYKLSSGRMFPTWSEVLEVLIRLGYEKPARAGSSAAMKLDAGTKPVKSAQTA